MAVTKKAELQSLIGTEMGVSDWITVDQGRIDVFADCTEDYQFIHVDQAKAAKTPFGGTIAHGFLSLSLLSKMAEGTSLVIEGSQMGLNYGFEKVRFLTPVPSGKRVRGQFVLKDVTEKSPGQFLITYAVSVEIEGIPKPALIADWLVMQIAP